MKWNVIRHLGVVLGAVALATILWGCSNVAPTSPSEPSLQTQNNNQPTGGGDSDTNQWW